MSNETNNGEVFLAGQGLLRKQIRSIMEQIMPAPGIPLLVEHKFELAPLGHANVWYTPGKLQFDWMGLVRKHGGPLLFARKIVGDENVDLLRSWLKRQRQQVKGTDFEGRLGLLPAIVYGQVNNLIAQREQDAKTNGLSEAFKAVFETSVARKCYGADAESHLQPDFDRMSEYSDVGPKNRGLYLGRFKLDYFRKGKCPSGLVQMETGSTRQWVIDIRHSADYNNPSAFTPVSKLGIGMAVYDQDSIREFVDRFYNAPERLIWRKVGWGKKERWSVWMASPKSGWIWSPLTYRSSKKVDAMAKGYQKYPRKVWAKGDRWITARKSGEDTLMVTVYQAVASEVIHPSKLLPELSRTRGEDVFSEACKEQRKLIKVVQETLMTLQEWGRCIAVLKKRGWTCKEV